MQFWIMRKPFTDTLVPTYSAPSLDIITKPVTASYMIRPVGLLQVKDVITAAICCINLQRSCLKIALFHLSCCCCEALVLRGLTGCSVRDQQWCDTIISFAEFMCTGLPELFEGWRCMAAGPGSFINPHASHAGSPGAAEVLWWVAAPGPAQPLGCRPKKDV